MTLSVEEVDEEAEEGDAVDEKSFAELLGPQCVIKRVDKDKNVLGNAKPEEMERELRTRASAQKRLGACAEHVRHMSRVEKLRWAIDLKDKANEFYAANNFEEAARLYSDCLVALDLDGSEEEVREVAVRLQLPVCTNLAACMIESGKYARCVEICDIALGVDSECAKALYRRGLARYRTGDHAGARPDFESALRSVRASRESQGEGAGSPDAEAEAEAKSLADLQRRLTVYLGSIHRHLAQEKQACQRMFDSGPLYEDRPDPVEPPVDHSDVDDSDEAIDAALAHARGDWFRCTWRGCCRRRPPAGKTKAS